MYGVPVESCQVLQSLISIINGNCKKNTFIFVSLKNNFIKIEPKALEYHDLLPHTCDGSCCLNRDFE